MKKRLLTFLLLIYAFAGNAQPTPADICGFYINDKFSNFLIITTNNDSIFFDGHSGKLECFGCPIKIINKRVLYISAMAIDNIELSFTNQFHNISFMGLNYKKVSIKDTGYSYSDSLLFYEGLGYLQAALSPNNTYRKEALLRACMPYFRKSIALNKDTINPYLNLGIAYYNLDMPDSTKIIWDMGKKIDPTDNRWPEYYKDLGDLYLKIGLQVNKAGNMQGAIELLNRGTIADPKNELLWYNLGGALFTAKRYTEAKVAWDRTLEINPDNENARRGLAAIPEEDK